LSSAARATRPEKGGALSRVRCNDLLDCRATTSPKLTLSVIDSLPLARCDYRRVMTLRSCAAQASRCPQRRLRVPLNRMNTTDACGLHLPPLSLQMLDTFLRPPFLPASYEQCVFVYRKYYGAERRRKRRHAWDRATRHQLARLTDRRSLSVPAMSEASMLNAAHSQSESDGLLRQTKLSPQAFQQCDVPQFDPAIQQLWMSCRTKWRRPCSSLPAGTVPFWPVSSIQRLGGTALTSPH
jgi:hypothetical protein